MILLQLVSLFALSTTQPKPTLIYVGDPMCSWCYGVSEEMAKVKSHYKDRYSFELIMGGLRPYNTQTMVELKDFLTGHWKEVNHRSGQEFKYDILDDTSITYDTEPPCRAVTIVREMKPEQSFLFFKEVQKAFYKDNKNMHQAESYRAALKSTDISFEIFESQFNSEEAKVNVKKDFELSAQMGVRGFPTLLLVNENGVQVISRGYMTAEQMIQKINSL